MLPRVIRRRAAALLLLNAALALLVHASAPAAPKNSDRGAYEDVGRHPLATGCGWQIYCYRVLVPAALEAIPIDSETRWRGYQVTATAAAGWVTSMATIAAGGGAGAAAIAAVLAQTGYGFAFTAYDPYSAEAGVFVFAALILFCWIEDRWRAALVIGLIGVFAKETVALVTASCMLAAFARDRATWRAWIVSGAIVCAALLAFHWTMDRWFGWGVTANAAAGISSGSWLAVWWRNNPFLGRKLFMLFAPFGFAWVFAVPGYRIAGRPLRRLALGAIVPFVVLCYVQTPERALSNAFFVIVPLAALYLERARFDLGFVMAAVNGVITAKVGTSTTWLPSSTYVVIAALPLAAWIVYSGVSQERSSNPAAP
jgi:hypothetical protein